MNAPIRDWAGKRVWIVGASSGIGEALARALLAKGARVALSARSRGKIEALAGANPNALALPLDVTAPLAFTPALERNTAAWGGPDLVAFAAATYAPIRAWELSADTARNDFRMPALISAEEAARQALRGFAQGRFEIHFPQRFTWAMKLLALLPYPLYFPLVRRLTGL